LDAQFYYKLSGLANCFGINAKAVLIADTEEDEDDETACVNSMQRARGDMMGVVTIWKKTDISNIGNTLMRVLNGKYEGGE
jgi:hypothetical protein